MFYTQNVLTQVETALNFVREPHVKGQAHASGPV